MAEENNPVYVSSSFRSFSYSPLRYVHKDSSSINVGKLMGGYAGFLASSCIIPLNNVVVYGVLYATSTEVEWLKLTDSSSEEESHIRYTRPLINLNLMIEVTGGEGTIEAPWQIVM